MPHQSAASNLKQGSVVPVARGVFHATSLLQRVIDENIIGRPTRGFEKNSGTFLRCAFNFRLEGVELRPLCETTN